MPGDLTPWEWLLASPWTWWVLGAWAVAVGVVVIGERWRSR